MIAVRPDTEGVATIDAGGNIGTEEWSLVGLWCVLIPAGILTMLTPPRRTRERSTLIKRGGWAMVLMGGGALCDLVPRLLGWPYSAEMALSTVALLSAVAAALLLALNLAAFAHPTGGKLRPIQPGGNTAAEYGNQDDE